MESPKRGKILWRRGKASMPLTQWPGSSPAARRPEFLGWGFSGSGFRISGLGFRV